MPEENKKRNRSVCLPKLGNEVYQQAMLDGTLSYGLRDADGVCVANGRLRGITRPFRGSADGSLGLHGRPLPRKGEDYYDIETGIIRPISIS